MSSSRKWFPGSGAVQLTEGPIAKQLVGFAIPLFLGSLIQQLYSTVDLMFVGKLIGRDASAAVGSSGLMVTCIVGFFTGLSVGVGVVAGQAAGRRDEQELRRIIHTAAGFTALMALVFLILGQMMVVPVLKAMHTPGDIMAQAMAYIRIYLFSLPAIVTYNVGTGVIRALGNSRSPTLYQLIGGIGNVIVNALFIALLKWGVQGAALATVCTQTLAAGLVLRHLCTLDAPYRLQFKQMRIEWDVCGRILSVGIPAAIQSIVIRCPTWWCRQISTCWAWRASRPSPSISRWRTSSISPSWPSERHAPPLRVRMSARDRSIAPSVEWVCRLRWAFPSRRYWLRWGCCMAGRCSVCSHRTTQSFGSA